MKLANNISRRDFLSRVISAGVFISAWVPFSQQASSRYTQSIRRFHISLQPEAWLNDPRLLEIIKSAGITDIWMASFIQGRWYRTTKDLTEYSKYLIEQGFDSHVLSVPLGHPGNALDPSDDSYSSSKKTWKNACTFDGQLFSGTSIHPPIVEENIEAVKLLDGEGFDILFLDDDFRLAKYPGQIGGCFCEECKNDFLNLYGYSIKNWELLLDSVADRDPSTILRSWIDYICDKEYNMFSELQKSSKNMNIGIMVMYLGSEKAGIRLEKYKQVPFRVGELMFDDKSFGKVKGKTDELFSALFHKRFIKPELAYSESTTYPADALSARNMAAKLNVSLISDIRNTMFMSGLQPFHIDYWEKLAPAMKKNALLHNEVAGLKQRGPFKHFWGWDSRLVGTDKPFSLFLASGIPFEVIGDLCNDGWIFLSNEDAKSVFEGRVVPKNNNLVVRNESNIKGKSFIQIEETMIDIFNFKNRIIPKIENIPYVEGEIPAIFSWYPSGNRALLWNVNEKRRNFNIILNGKLLRSVSVDGLDISLILNL